MTTDSNHALLIAENLLDREFSVDTPNARWAADITYIHTGEGWLYLAVILDLFSRRVVGWAMGETLERSLVLAALEMALMDRRPAAGLLCHSDRGSQYASGDYQDALKKAGAVCSMSRKGNCWDNAPTESFFATLKRELVYRTYFATRQEARSALFLWIAVWYNRKRRHSTLGYVSPKRSSDNINNNSNRGQWLPNYLSTKPTEDHFRKLQDGCQSQSPWGFGRLPLRREQIGELLIFKERAEFISHSEVGIALGEGRVGHASGFFRNRKGDFNLQAHGSSPTAKHSVTRLWKGLLQKAGEPAGFANSINRCHPPECQSMGRFLIDRMMKSQKQEQSAAALCSCFWLLRGQEARQRETSLLCTIRYPHKPMQTRYACGSTG